MNDLKSFLNQIHPLSESVFEHYRACWAVFEAPRKTILTDFDTTEGYLYFVEQGVQKSYYLHEGKAHLMFFSYPPSFSGVVESFFTQTPSRYCLETITDSRFLRISYADHSRLLTEHRELETLFRKLTEQLLHAVIERQHELLTFDAETRFRLFAKRSPHLFNMVTQKDLASYLRIDATNFSKMMNRIRI